MPQQFIEKNAEHQRRAGLESTIASSQAARLASASNTPDRTTMRALMI
jgi:hypothetical protein